MTSACVFWIIAAVVFGVIEGATVALITIWFALGAVAAAVAAQLGASVLAPVGTFVRKIAVKDPQRTNADRFIGREGIVIEAVDGINAAGSVKVGGQVWSAVSSDGSAIEKDERVEVIEISGVKLVVKPIKAD